MSTIPDDPARSEKARLARRKANRLLGLMLGLALGIVAAVAVLVLIANWHRRTTLDRARLEAQRAVWEKNRVPNYDIEVHVTGRREATYRVSVRDDVAVSATIDGRPLGDPRTYATWSVPGMFGTIERDVQAVESNQQADGQPSGPGLTLYASFDPQFGFPTKYQRIEWGEQSTNAEVTWTVQEFLPLDVQKQ